MHKDEIISKMHKASRKDSFTNEIVGSVGLSLDNFDSRMDDFGKQIDISTATWALPIYEKEVGIIPDISKSYEHRRESILSRLKSMSKIGAAELKLIADSYTNGDVEISLDHGIVVEFTSIYGVPSNINDLKTVLRSYAPAHIKVTFKFKYTFYSEITTYQYNQLSTKTYGELHQGGLS